MNSQLTGTDAPRQEHIDQVLDAKKPSPASTPVAHSLQRRQAAPRDGWKTQVGAMKAAFADLESICSGIIAQTLESDVEAAAIIEETNQRIAEVTSAADAAILRARLQADVETAELRQVVQRLRRELEAERNRACTGQMATDEAAALQAELKAARSESEDLARLLQAERAKRTRLIDAVRALQQPRIIALPVHSQDADAEMRGVRETDAESPSTHVEVLSLTAVDDARAPVRDAVSTEAAEEAPAGVPAATAALHFDLRDYARQLLDDIESVYDADDASGMTPSELVGRLVTNLIFATDVFDRRAGYAADREGVTFQQQIELTLDVKAGSSFGRHLAVAAHEYEQQRKQTDHACVA